MNLNKPNFTPYFKTPFSPQLIKWSKSKNLGNSIGNGALMRISPIGYLFNKEEDIIINTILATTPSHNTKEAIASTLTISLIIFYSRIVYKKEDIIKKLNIDLNYTKFTKFNKTCNETLPNCLYALFTSTTFEESIKTVISYGGDTDTNACIVGSMAEALYGINEHLILLAKEKIPSEFNEILKESYQKIRKLP